MIWENGIETCVISYKKQIASPGLIQDSGCSGLVHWDDPEGWYGEGGGRGIMMGNMCTPVVNSCGCMSKPIQYCKVIRNKKEKKEKKKKKNKVYFVLYENCYSSFLLLPICIEYIFPSSHFLFICVLRSKVGFLVDSTYMFLVFIY